MNKDNVREFQPAAILRPARNEVRLRASQIKRPPAKRLAEALLEQFPEIDIVLRDDGWTAAAVLNGHAVMLCETYKHQRDLREGWWTLMDEVFPQMVAYFQQIPPLPQAANEAPVAGTPSPEEHPSAAPNDEQKPTAEVVSLVERQMEQNHP